MKKLKKIPTQQENPKGLHQRYIVTKTDGEPVDDFAEYFVLRLDGGGNDPKHIKACRKAVRKYAKEIKNHLPELSKDLLERYPKIKEDKCKCKKEGGCKC